VLSIDRVQDIEVLRQATKLLDRENRNLHQRLRELCQKLAVLEGRDASQLEIEVLRELERLQPKPAPPTPAPIETTADRGAMPRPGHGPRPQPRLPIEVVVSELLEGHRDCPHCGLQMDPFGEEAEESEEITVVERQFVLRHHVRAKYRCRCNGAVRTAPASERLIPGGRYSIEFAVEVAIDKYLDHLPLERQVRRMEREGLTIDSQTLWDQLWALCQHLEPTYEALGRRVLERPVVHVDETRWPLLDAKESSPHSVFGLVSGDTAFYRIPVSKSTQSARKVLAGFRGTAVADGYQVYEILSRAGPFRLAHCWAHVKRKFSELGDTYPVECGEMLGLIHALYEVERSVETTGDEGLERRRRLRQERSRPIVESIRSWCFAQRRLPRSALGRAIEYVLKYWDGLIVFLEDPRVPLDNNAVERALRGPVVGRKNHYGSKSKRGTQVAAILYTLCETAKLCGVDPKAFLITAARRAIRNPGTVTLPQPAGVVFVA
jgi:transposase